MQSQFLFSHVRSSRLWTACIPYYRDKKAPKTRHPDQSGRDGVANMQTLNVVQAAIYTSLSKSSLDKLRVYGGGPLFIKVGARVIYDRVDLDGWMIGKKIANTSQTVPIAA